MYRIVFIIVDKEVDAVRRPLDGIYVIVRGRIAYIGFSGALVANPEIIIPAMHRTMDIVLVLAHMLQDVNFTTVWPPVIGRIVPAIFSFIIWIKPKSWPCSPT